MIAKLRKYGIDSHKNNTEKECIRKLKQKFLIQTTKTNVKFAFIGFRNLPKPLKKPYLVL